MKTMSTYIYIYIYFEVIFFINMACPNLNLNLNLFNTSNDVRELNLNLAKQMLKKDTRNET